MKKYLGFWVLVFGPLLWQSCRKEPLNHLTPDESVIYITQRDTAIKFTAYTTFSVNDSVAVLQNGQPVGMARGPVDSVFIQAFATSMQQAGYILVAKTDSPNLAINLTHIYNNYVAYAYFSDYGDYWDPYYWGYGGYGYGFPYYYAAYSISQDALAVDMFDLKNAVAKKQLTDVWSALIQGPGVYQQASAAAEVDSLFSQSAYLKQ
jgi:hypothetical protein